MEHRLDIIKEIVKLEWDSLLEIGCDGNALPNLRILQVLYGYGVNLAGFDKEVTETGQALARNAGIGLFEIALTGESVIEGIVDVILCSSFLMYMRGDISQLAKRMAQSAKKYLVISELDSEEYQDLTAPGSDLVRVSRNYRELFPQFDFKVIECDTKIWPGSSYPHGLGKILIGTKK